MAAKFTRGPWVVGPQFSVRTAAGAVVAYPQSAAVGSPEEFQANARLLAAGPEMYAALKMIEDDPGLTASANEIVRLAIAAAE